MDAMGGDNAPKEVVKAVVKAVDELDVEIILVGKESEINKELSNCNCINKDKIIIHNAEEIITNDDSPAMAIKSKKNSSLVVAMNLLKDGVGDGLISAGNTGAILAGALLIVKRLEGVDRPSLAPIIPTKEGVAVIVDGGSNVDCKPINLCQFAVMGSIYMKKAFGIESPRVGLLNIGAEEKKGNELTKQTYEELKKMDNINFIGNVEGRDVTEGKTDVIVCDGFAGNILLKVMEGMGMLITGMLKEELKRNFVTKLGALISSTAFKNLKKKMDYKEHGGGIFLGVNTTIIKVHGSSDEKLFYNTIKQTKRIIESGIIEEIKEEIIKVKEI